MARKKSRHGSVHDRQRKATEAAAAARRLVSQETHTSDQPAVDMTEKKTIFDSFDERLRKIDEFLAKPSPELSNHLPARSELSEPVPTETSIKPLTGQEIQDPLTVIFLAENSEDRELEKRIYEETIIANRELLLRIQTGFPPARPQDIAARIHRQDKRYWGMVESECRIPQVWSEYGKRRRDAEGKPESDYRPPFMKK